MRELRYRSATNPGKYVFMAQVKCSAPAVSNFRAAMKMTLGISGRLFNAPGSSRSQGMISMPCASSSAGKLALLKRATATMRCLVPARSAARRASRARLGPILPPTPRIKRSPFKAVIAEASASPGRESRSSNSATFWIFIINQVQNQRWRNSLLLSPAGLFRGPYAEGAFL